MKRSDIASVSTDRGFIANIVLGTGDHVCMFRDFALNFLFFCAFVFSFRSVSYFFRRPAGASHIFMELVMELSGYKRRKRRQGRTSDRATLADVFAAKGLPRTDLFIFILLHISNLRFGVLVGGIEEIQSFFEISVNSSYEGLIFKTLNIDAAYEPSRRSHNWLKLKRAYFEGLGDSLYLVPVAAYYGHGNQTGVYGTFVPACYDTNKEEFQSISKIGRILLRKGFSDALLEERSASLGSKVIPKPKKGSTLMYGLTQHREFQHFDDFTLASSWESLCRQWLADGLRNLL
ncbi:hypothetical protein OROGR_008530 [Orobanche gracilis]